MEITKRTKCTTQSARTLISIGDATKRQGNIRRRKFQFGLRKLKRRITIVCFPVENGVRTKVEMTTSVTIRLTLGRSRIRQAEDRVQVIKIAYAQVKPGLVVAQAE